MIEWAEEKVQELQSISRAFAEQEIDVETEAEIEKIEALLEAPYWIIDICLNKYQQILAANISQLKNIFYRIPSVPQSNRNTPM